MREGALDGAKVGHAWMLSEESAYDRLSKKPRAGRRVHTTNDAAIDGESAASNLHDPYLECKQAFRFEPPIQAIENASSQEEAGFYMAVADYFLQCKQRELITQGVH